jgi:hypothetical protein
MTRMRKKVSTAAPAALLNNLSRVIWTGILRATQTPAALAFEFTSLNCAAIKTNPAGSFGAKASVIRFSVASDC